MMLDTSIKEINKLFRFHHIDDEIMESKDYLEQLPALF